MKITRGSPLTTFPGQAGLNLKSRHTARGLLRGFRPAIKLLQDRQVLEGCNRRRLVRTHKIQSHHRERIASWSIVDHDRQSPAVLAQVLRQMQETAEARDVYGRHEIEVRNHVALQELVEAFRALLEGVVGLPRQWSDHAYDRNIGRVADIEGEVHGLRLLGSLS